MNPTFRYSVTLTELENLSANDLLVLSNSLNFNRNALYNQLCGLSVGLIDAAFAIVNEEIKRRMENRPLIDQQTKLSDEDEDFLKKL